MKLNNNMWIPKHICLVLKKQTNLKNNQQLITKRIPSSKWSMGGGSIMRWGWFSSDGTGALFMVKGIINSTNHHSILAQNLLLKDLRWIEWQWPKPHNGMALSEQGEGLQWPSQISDLNPIGTLWGDLKAMHSGCPGNWTELKWFSRKNHKPDALN